MILMLYSFINIGFFTRTSKSGTGQSDAMLFAILSIRSCTINLICKDPFWVISGSVTIMLNSINQTCAFVIGIKAELFYSAKSLVIKAEIELCTKLDRSFTLPLTIGLIHGWVMLTILFSTLWTLLSYIYFCCYRLLESSDKV